jgi:hypothetical protein
MELTSSPARTIGDDTTRRVPLQILVVVVLLGLEGFGNLVQAVDPPIAVDWFTAKVLFITGLLNGWRWVYILFVIIAAQHVIGFWGINFPAVVMNLRLIVLTLSALMFYFLARDESSSSGQCRSGGKRRGD